MTPSPRGIGGLGLWLACGVAAAQTAAPAEPIEPPVWEATRSAVRSTAEWLARGVDGWFGDKPFEDGGKVSDGQLSVSLLHRQDEGTSASVRFNARFRLPNIEENAYLFVGRDNPRDVITDKPQAFSRQQRLLPERADERRFIAGLGLDPTERLGFRIGLRSGIKPFAQARYSKPWTIGERNLLVFRQTLFWTVDDHLGATTALSYDHALTSTLAVRWLGAATITQEVGKVEWSTSVGGFKSFGAQRLLSLEVLASGRQGTGVQVDDYGVQTRWEQPLGRDWLLGELVAGHFWPRTDPNAERGRAWALGAGLKLRF